MQPYYFILDNDSATVLCQVDTVKEAQTIAEKEAIMHPSKTFRILKCIGFSQTSGANTFWMDDEEPKQEPQYRMLEEGELVELGDSYHSSVTGLWCDVTEIDTNYRLHKIHVPHRRPINPNQL